MSQKSYYVISVGGVTKNSRDDSMYVLTLAGLRIFSVNPFSRLYLFPTIKRADTLATLRRRGRRPTGMGRERHVLQ